MNKIKGRSRELKFKKRMSSGAGGTEYPQHSTTKTDLRLEQRSGWVALIAAIAAIVMLFASFSSSFIDRVIQGNLLQLFPPTALWFSTGAIMTSSLFAELARTSARKSQWSLTKRNLWLTLLTGLGFIVGQYVAWTQLYDMGVYLQTNPHSSFFFLLTLMHVLHVLGGVTWLVITTVRVTKIGASLRLVNSQNDNGETLTSTEIQELRTRNSVSLCVTYWHFVGVLWIYLYLLLFAF